MPDAKISDLNNVVGVALIDLLAIVNTSQTKNISIRQLVDYILNGTLGTNVPVGAFSVSSSGDVKIGINNYTAKLNVTGGARVGPDSASLISLGTSLSTGQKGLQITFDTTNDLAILQAIEQGVAFKDITLNPSGGNLGVATLTPNTTFENAGSFIAGSAITVTAGTYNSLNIAGVKTLIIDASGGNVIINGFTGGVNKQELSIIKRISAGTVTLNHNNASGTQKIFNKSGINYTSAAYDNIDLYYNGGWMSNV
jgi:hypothetical protein